LEGNDGRPKAERGAAKIATARDELEGRRIAETCRLGGNRIIAAT
jgi:hypothetical protein